jgi:hypothetical protein
MMRSLKKTLLLAAFGTVMTAAPAHAVQYTFGLITDNGNGANLAGQLIVDVTAGLNGTVDFTFTNNVGIASSITDVYFDDGTLLDLAGITSSAGVAFLDPASPGNLPSGNTASPPFVTTADFSADSDSPITANGVNAAGEWLTINFTLQGLQTYQDTINALNSGALRIGLHVQAIGVPGGSDSYVNTVPDGGVTMALLGMALTGLGLMARRKK